MPLSDEFGMFKIMALMIPGLMIGLSTKASQAPSHDMVDMPMTFRSAGTPHIPPARAGDIAIQEELEAARKAGTAEAFELFLERHPNHPLSTIAKREYEQILNASKAR